MLPTGNSAPDLAGEGGEGNVTFHLISSPPVVLLPPSWGSWYNNLGATTLASAACSPLSSSRTALSLSLAALSLMLSTIPSLMPSSKHQSIHPGRELYHQCCFRRVSNSCCVSPDPDGGAGSNWISSMYTPSGKTMSAFDVSPSACVPPRAT